MRFLSRRSEHTPQKLKIGNLPQGSGWRFIIRPFWLFSLGLHLLVLRLPLPATQPQSQTAKSVKITKLTAIPKPSPTTSPPAKAAVAKPNPGPKTIAKAAGQPPNKKTTQAAQNPASPKVTTTPSPMLKPKDTPEPLSGTALKQLLQFPNASIGCGGKCAETPASLPEVAALFEKKLARAKLKIDRIKVDPSRRVYRIDTIKPTKFLSIFLRPDHKITTYAFADQEINLADLTKAEEESITSMGDVLGDIKGFDFSPADADSTAQPQIFASRQSEWVEPMNELREVQPDEAWNTILKQRIQANGFDVSMSNKSYGGGKIYVLNRQLFTGYLNLVPNKEGNGTVIVLWKVLPN
jgi:hypothetical protein